MQTKDLAYKRLRHIIFGFLIGLALATPQIMLAADRTAGPPILRHLCRRSPH